jgi:hypothetical protein
MGCDPVPSAQGNGVPGGGVFTIKEGLEKENDPSKNEKISAGHNRECKGVRAGLMCQETLREE